MQSQIISLLNQFNTFSLQELEAANLLERKDFKYVFAAEEFLNVLPQLMPHYKILSINDTRYTDYLTHYYDTHDFNFYLQHHNGESNRYKIRLREYVQSAISFYEVKFKNNKNWTSKFRKKIKDLDININEFTKEITTDELERKLIVEYSRITMLSNDGHEKLTFDLNLTYRNDTDTCNYHHLCIAEVKSKTHNAFVFRQLIKKMGYRTQSLSKYCFGISSLYRKLKDNNFKKYKLYLNKIAS